MSIIGRQMRLSRAGECQPIPRLSHEAGLHLRRGQTPHHRTPRREDGGAAPARREQAAGNGADEQHQEGSGIVSSAALLSYPVDLAADDNDTILVTFPDVSGAITYGDDEDQALANAVVSLESIFSALITDRRDIPLPSPARGRKTVSPSLLGSLKISLYRAMRERGWRKADLARAMALNPRQIDRLLDLRHSSTVAQLEQALAACGKRVDLDLRQLKAA